MSGSDPQSNPDGRYWYAVEIRSGEAPVTGNLGIKFGGTKLRAVEFEIGVNESEVAQSGDSALAAAERYSAAREGIEAAIADRHDWPSGEYRVTVRGRVSASTYLAEVDQDGLFSLRSIEE